MWIPPPPETGQSQPSLMESLEQAVLLCLNPTVDAATKMRAMQICDQLKHVSSGWRQVFGLFTRTPRPLAEVQFFCVQLFEDFVRSEDFNESSQLRTEVFSFVAFEVCQGHDLGPTYLKNKLAHFFSLVFVRQYVGEWADCFDRMLEWLSSSSAHAADMFLRICLAIHDEIAGKHLQRTELEHTRNALIKDAMRARDIPRLASAWISLLEVAAAQEAALVKMILRVISSFAEWIDVSLVANPALLSRVYALMQFPAFRLEATDCLCEIVSKGMPVGEKYKLEVYLNLASLFDQADCGDQELFGRVCKLMAIAGHSLCIGISELETASPSRAEIFAYVASLMPNAIRFLWASSPENTIVLVPFIHSFLEMVKMQKNELDDAKKTLILDLLEAVVAKSMFPDSFDFECPGEDEDTFYECRRRLEPVFDSIMSTLSYPATMAIHQRVMRTLAAPMAGQFREIELAMYLVLRFSDAMKGSPPYVITINNVSKVTPFGQMVSSVILSDLESFPSKNITLLYFEIAVKYASTGFCDRFPESLQKIAGAFFLVAFCHCDVQVRQRTFVLFHKLVKALREKIAGVSDFVENLAAFIKTLSLASLGSAEQGLLEAFGMTVALSNLEGSMQAAGLRDAAAGFLVAASYAPSSAEQLQVVASGVSGLGSIVKGYIDGCRSEVPAPIGSLFQEFCNAVTKSLYVLAPPPGQLASAVVYASQRLISVPKLGVRELLGQLFVLAASQDDLDLEVELISLVTVAIFRKRHEIIDLLGPQLPRILGKVVSLLSLRPSGTDDVVKIAELRSKMLAALTAMFTFDIFVPIVGGGDVFGSFEAIFFILMDSLGCAWDNPQGGRDKQQDDVGYENEQYGQGGQCNRYDQDGQVIRHALSIVNRIAALCCSNESGPTGQQSLEFIYSRILPLCFTIPLSRAFLLRDNQGQAVLAEIASLQKCLWRHRPTHVQRLCSDLLANVPAGGLGLSPQAIAEYTSALGTFDAKELKAFLTVPPPPQMTFILIADLS